MRIPAVFRILSLAMVTALFVAGCGGTPPAPSVTSVTVSPATATLNIGGTQQLIATVVVQNGAATTVTWSSSNTAVASVSNTGLVTANAAGTATITATSTVDGSKKGTATITVNAPTISGVSISPPSALLNIGGTQQFTANVTGSLGFNPAVTWSTSNATVASVSNTGLVTANAAGTATITATSVADPSKSASATVTVVDTLTFQNYSAVVATVGQAIPTQNASVAGGSTPYSFTAIDPLPAGLSLDPASGAISGTPTTASAATNYTIQVTDSLGATASATINITVNAAPSVSYSQTLALTVGIPVVAANYSGSASGGTAPLSYSASGLPAGLSIDSSTGAISGTPISVGSNSVTVTVTDANGATASDTFTFDVNPAPSVGTNYTSPVALTVGQAFTSSTPVVSDGTAPFTFSATSLPAGLSVNSSTGVVSGTPGAALAAADYTVTATDANGATTNFTINITVNAAPSVGTNYTSPVIAAQGYSFTSSTPVVSGGTAPFSFAISPVLPTGLSINSSTGVISGTPTTTYPATTYTVTATDANGATVNFSINITVNTPPSLSYNVTRNLTDGQPVTTGNFTVTTGGGTLPNTYTLSSGSLPPGLTLNSGTGAITGTPSTVGSYSAVIRVTDSAGYFADATFAIVVNPVPTLNYTPSNPVTISSAATTAGQIIAQPVVSGGTGPFTYAINANNPFNQRFNFNTATGVVTAKVNNPPTTPGLNRTITVTDANGATATYNITFVVNP